ncbi:hypothetical protein Tco_0955890 [Tanacetum coccineum]|uniref:Uncharacterized protein n=1 Tax=Tanacetum coccineum TaxID=301880 RepID=A0ABQ5E8G0_9ASTR
MEEMMVRLDNFVRSKEAFAHAKLPKGEAFEHSGRMFPPAVRRDDRPQRNIIEEILEEMTTGTNEQSSGKGSLEPI